MMPVQAHRAQVRQANFAREIADRISLLALSLYRDGWYPTSIMASSARFNSATTGVPASPGRRWIRDDDRPTRPPSAPRYRAAQVARIQRVQAGGSRRTARRRAVHLVAHRDRQGAHQVGLPEPDA